MTKQQTSSHSRFQVVRSSLWVFGGQIGGQVLRLTGNLVMTRLLVPEMFGVMAVANTILLGLQLCSYIGLQHNIIQSPRGDEKEFLDTAWVIQVLRGIFLWLLALGISLGLYFANQYGFVSPGSVYADENLPMVIAAISFYVLISGFDSMKLATASRHMVVDKLTMIEIGSQIISLLSMIVFALFYRSIWALVIGALVGAVVRLVVSHTVFAGPRNKFAWEKRTFIEILHFGKWILLTTIMGYFVRNSDKLILGALVSPQILGVYSIAIFMTAAIQEILIKWAGAVVLPVFSRTYREKSTDLINAYYKFSLPFNLATLFLCGFLFNAGHIIVEVLYDDRYSAAGHMIQILSLSLLGSRTILAEQCYLALGKPKLSVPMNVIQLSVLFVALVPTYHRFGMGGALYVIALAIILTLPLTWHFLYKHSLLDWRRELLTLPALPVGYVFSELFVTAYNSIKLSL